MIVIFLLIFVDFNPRPREEGDGSYRDNVGAPINFNPRPREEGNWSSQTLQRQQVHFNPRTREEGDKVTEAFEMFVDISIHALVKRAT